jgi:hypothetical protein
LQQAAPAQEQDDEGLLREPSEQGELPDISAVEHFHDSKPSIPPEVAIDAAAVPPFEEGLLEALGMMPSIQLPSDAADAALLEEHWQLLLPCLAASLSCGEEEERLQAVRRMRAVNPTLRLQPLTE